MLKWVRGDENDIRGENTQLAQGARAIPLVFGFGFGLYWIGLDYSRTLPRFAAICRNLPQAVLCGFGIFRFAVADALVFAPIWELTLPTAKSGGFLLQPSLPTIDRSYTMSTSVGITPSFRVPHGTYV